MKTRAIIIITALGICHALAGVPLKWTVETSRLQPVVFDVVRGETLELEAALTSYGSPLDLTGRTAQIFWQTNGMDAVWWSTNATISASNHVSAAFEPTMDPGASAVNGFLGVAGDVYRAAFTLRFRPGPGATPNALALPAQRLDFAAVEILNPPYYTRDEVDGALDGKLDSAGPNGMTLTLSNNRLSGTSWDLISPGIVGDMNGNRLDLKADVSDVTALGATVNAWQSYWDGDDVRVTVTNYFGAVDDPSMYLEQKVSNGVYKVIWTETNRLSKLAHRLDLVEQGLEDKADRAWGFYDSHTGGWAPDGFTSISSGSILVAKDMAYQRTVTTSGSVWVLTATTPTTITGVTDGGVFKISDADGNDVFTIRKGDKRVVGATASEVVANGSTLRVTYNVTSDEHPVAEVCTNLTTANWISESEPTCLATVTWSGSSGAWVVDLTPKAATNQIFCKATYEIGSETKIIQNAPVEMQKIIIGTKTYAIGTAVISGSTVMTLTEVQ